VRGQRKTWMTYWFWLSASRHRFLRGIVDGEGFSSWSKCSSSSDLVVLFGAMLARGDGIVFRGPPSFRFGGSRSSCGSFAARILSSTACGWIIVVARLSWLLW
jgi:hypothetical protein